MPSFPPRVPRPDRAELFAFYYLGFSPAGEYGFANAHMVAQHYQVPTPQVLRWLDELDLSPKRMLDRQYFLGRAQADLQMEAPMLTPEGVRRRIDQILEEIDDSPTGRRVWEED